jgi:hypothetical protein
MSGVEDVMRAGRESCCRRLRDRKFAGSLRVTASEKSLIEKAGSSIRPFIEMNQPQGPATHGLQGKPGGRACDVFD